MDQFHSVNVLHRGLELKYLYIFLMNENVVRFPTEITVDNFAAMPISSKIRASTAGVVALLAAHLLVSGCGAGQPAAALAE